MMGQQTHTESLFYYFRFEDQIPEDHLLRLIDRHIDFSFVRKQLKEFLQSDGPTVDRSGSAATPVGGRLPVWDHQRTAFNGRSKDASGLSFVHAS